MGVMVNSAAAVVLARAELATPHAFDGWMIAEQRRVWSICQHMLGDRDEADSATQDVFLKAYQALVKDEAKAVDDPSRWLTRIAVNTCLDRLRSRKWQFWRRRPAAEEEARLLHLQSSTAPEAEEQCFASEIRKRLGKALVRLSPRQRAVFTLRHFEGLSLEEIASVLTLDSGTVKAHMFRAVSKLREELRDLYGVAR
jgi:RNA polymerase sigma-70 factor, ECF subfamily